ncbi:MAG: HupE/UreJ family protein, partial [Blastochloris sp.]|nr:HupE/UreJ family protein [Blastochloris sp.]
MGIRRRAPSCLGFTHILGGLDHLLFVFCLVIPVRRWRPLVAIVSAFTVATGTSAQTASKVAWVPAAGGIFAVVHKDGNNVWFRRFNAARDADRQRAGEQPADDESRERPARRFGRGGA